VFYAYGSGFFGEYVILMEDLTAKKAINAGLIFGNQCWGMQAPLDPPVDPLETLEAMYLKSADFHARFWRDERLMREKWMKWVGWYDNREREIWQTGVDSGFQAWKNGRVRPGVKLSPDLVKIIDRSFEMASWEELQAYLHDPRIPWTLTHGDFHAGNLMYIREGKQIKYFDWSEIGPGEPTTDLAQTLISDVSPALFSQTKPLLRKYWEKLIALGVPESDYSFEFCWQSFCAGGVERWIWMFAVISGCTWMQIPDAFVQYLHDQIVAFIVAHGKQEYYVLKSVAVVPESK